MTEKDLKKWADEIYQVGFRNGQIEMKNKVLKTINRDWKIVRMKNPVDVAMHFLKKINKLKLSKDLTVDNPTGIISEI